MKSIRRPQLVENGAKNLRPVGFETGRAARATGWCDTWSYQTRLCHDSMRCFKKKHCASKDFPLHKQKRYHCDPETMQGITFFFWGAALRLHHALQSLYFTCKYHTTWDILVTKLAKGTEPNGKFCRYGVKSSNVSPSWNRSYVEK